MNSLRRSSPAALVAAGAIAIQLFAGAARGYETESPSSTPAPPPVPAFDPSPLPPDGGPGGGPMVTLQANLPLVYLEQLRMDWIPVCAPPCRMTLDPNRHYRVTGHTLLPTAPFQLPSRSGEVRVTARMGRKATRVVGLIVLGAGVGTAGMGALWTSSPLTLSSEPIDPNQRQMDESTGRKIMLFGGVVAIIGLALAGFSGSSVDLR